MSNVLNTPLCSGFGQFHSDRHATNPKPYTSITLADILALLVSPQQIDKSQAQWVIPSATLSRAKDDQLATGKFYALWQDIDAPSGLSLQSMANTLVGIVDATVWAYTSKSATADNQKCRMVIPLAQPIDAVTFNLVQRVINAKLVDAGITPDTANERINQVFYLPNRGEYYEHCVIDNAFGYLFAETKFKNELASIVAADEKAESDRLAAREVSRVKASARVSAGTHSPITAFNAEYDIHNLLIGYGYQKKGKDRYLSPNSTSGIAGVTVTGNKYKTSHQSDLDAGLRASGDAFDLFTFYEHGNDHNAALKAAGAMFITTDGLSMTKSNQVAYMQQQAKASLEHGASVAAVLLANSEPKYTLAKSANCANSGVTTPSAHFADDANSANCGIDCEIEASDNLQAIPRPTPEQAETMLYGTVGLFAKAAADGKGLDPIAAALACLTWLGTEVSPRIVLQIADSYHPARIFGVHVGRSSRGAKGDSSQLLKKVIRRISKQHSELLGAFHSGGLSTREGLALQLHDGFTQGEQETPAVTDKRLFVIESEFANIMAQTKRDGNTLSTALRDAFDYPCKIDPMTKTNRISSTNPHIGILGNITPYELASKLSKNEISNGVINRFMLIYSERMANVPFPPATDNGLVDMLANEFASVIHWAKGSYGDSSFDLYDSQVVATLDNHAKAFWVIVFDELSNPYGGEFIAAATDRRRVFALRLALLFAITDKSLVIQEHHIRAGVEWARFSARTAAYVLGGAGSGDVETVDKTQLDKLMTFLKSKKGFVSRTDISADCFKRHISKTKLDGLLQLAIDSQLIERKQQLPKAGGTMVTMYGIKTNSTLRTLRNECEQLPSASILDNSHNSHNSQHVICANSKNIDANSEIEVLI
jgi:putative DNA primase/helicase